MVLEDQKENLDPKGYECETKVDLEVELISALSELAKVRKKYVQVKE